MLTDWIRRLFRKGPAIFDKDFDPPFNPPKPEPDVIWICIRAKKLDLKYNPLEDEDDNRRDPNLPCQHSTHYGLLWEHGRCRSCGVSEVKYRAAFEAAYQAVKRHIL